MWQQRQKPEWSSRKPRNVKNWWKLGRDTEKAMAPHSSTLAWKIPWMEEPGRLQSMGVAKSRTRLSDFILTFHFPALEKEMATHYSVLAWRIPGTGEPGGLPSMGSHRVGHNWSNLAAGRGKGKNSTQSLRGSTAPLTPCIQVLASRTVRE